MNKQINIQFTGRNIERYDFLDNFTDEVCKFLGRGWEQDKELHIYNREIIKNIHDHNGGFGYVNIEVLPDGIIKVEINNSPCPTSVEKEYSPERKVNCNVGRRIIKGEKSPFYKNRGR